MSNRLEGEKSPYLLQHKDNPVNWYPWGEEAFEKAREEDKPVFLSIGYSTCHWCHVMVHESFENPEIARLLEDYVCIKVDREERPDIDAVYMTVCQALNGSGGWPLTIFLTPEQKPFFAGTYFPRTGRYGQPGLTELLVQISMIWHTQREKLLESGERITAALRQNYDADAADLNTALLEQGVRLLVQSFDRTWGGFGQAPKFPTPHNLLYLMRFYQATHTPKAMQIAETTLHAMAAGGIFDHIGGGFSRYSTDTAWLVPHFEKMLYDNALLISAYLESFQLTGKPCYADTARRTIDYILTELTDDDGGFYCGQDADSDGVEGKYYVFRPDEIIHVLGAQDGAEFCRLYDITETGNFEGQSIPNLIGKEEGWTADDPRLKKLYAYRKKRTALHLDNKILLSWNAWTIISLSKAGMILDDSRYTDAAVSAQQFIRRRMTDAQDRLYLRYCDGEAAHPGQLNDYASYTLALIELYRATFDIAYLKEAVFRARQMMELFADRETNGYYMTAHDAGKLIMRPKETYDGAIPSGNSAAEMALEQLACLTGEQFFREAADRQHRFMAGQVKASPASHCFALSAMAEALYPHRELIITGNRVPHEITAHLTKQPAHDLSILFKSAENAQQLSELAPFSASYPVSRDTVWYLCENGACCAPVTEFDALKL